MYLEYLNGIIFLFLSHTKLSYTVFGWYLGILFTLIAIIFPQRHISLGKSNIELLSKIKSPPIISLDGSWEILQSPIYKFPLIVRLDGSSFIELPSQLKDPSQ